MQKELLYMNDNQLMVITGPRGVGKTMLAGTFMPATKEAMARVFWHDSEQSANRMNSSYNKAGMPLGYYHNIGSRFSEVGSTDDLISQINQGEFPWVSEQKQGALIDYYQHTLKDIDENLEYGKFDVYVHDTLEKLEAGMAAFVDNNKRVSGVRSVAYGKLWSDGVFPLYEALVEALYARGVKTIILTSHLKNPWVDNKPIVGKVAPSGKKLLYKLSSLMIWLVNNRKNADGAPAGLILKERMGNLIAVDGVWKPRRMLPERIPHCTWVDINNYLENGCDLANPAEGESMSDREREMISELITDEQMRLMTLAEEKEIQMIANQQSDFGNTLAPGQQMEAVPDSSEEVIENTQPAVTVEDSQRAFIELHHKQCLSPMQIANQINLPLP